MLVHTFGSYLTYQWIWYAECRYILGGIKSVEKHVTNIHLNIQTKNDLGKSIGYNEPLHRFPYEWFGFMFAGHKSR